MAHILAVGVATLDIINAVDAYPQEDAKIRATGQRISRGGNAANTLVVLSQLGQRCKWAGTLGGDYAADLIVEDLQGHGIDCSACRIYREGSTPTSYIVHNTRNGSRTIIHYRDLPEYSGDDFEHIPLHDLDWIHFEGRNIPETKIMLERARAECPTTPRSLEIEKSRPGIEQLFALADVLIFSRDYVRDQGTDDAQAFLQHVHRQTPHADLVCAWGEQGAYGIDRQGRASASPPSPPPAVIDSLGAGDTFNAGIIDAYTRQYPLPQALGHACHLAGMKCGHQGLNFIKPDCD